MKHLKKIYNQIEEIINGNPKLKAMIEESEKKESWLFKDLDHENLSNI